jgi:fido (protein-threonine AMPylation protein)
VGAGQDAIYRGFVGGETGLNGMEYEKITEERDYKKRSYNWKTAIGLQKVDNLVPSRYLLELADLNIKGEISLSEVRAKIEDYYEHKPQKEEAPERQKEADFVSQRISEILSERAFSLSPVELLSIHKRLFEGIYDFAGKIRTYNISKKEYVLDGETVEYGDCAVLGEMLEHDIGKEKRFDYSSLDGRARIAHFAGFIADLWQIHPFAEGNTRAAAVFAIKYLRKLGFDINNDLFEKESWYFRNALVRANHTDFKKNIHKTDVWLMKFFGNLLLGEENVLKNRELRVNI